MHRKEMIHPGLKWFGIPSLVILAALIWKVHSSFAVSKGLALAGLMELVLIFGAFVLGGSRSGGSADRHLHSWHSWHHLGPWLNRQ